MEYSTEWENWKYDICQTTKTQIWEGKVNDDSKKFSKQDRLQSILCNVNNVANVKIRAFVTDIIYLTMKIMIH